MRVNIVGHASARWRSAATAKRADVLNERLALRRAEAVKRVVERILNEQFDGQVAFEVGVSRDDADQPQGVEVGAVGLGSRDARQASGDDRSHDDPVYRRVDVTFDIYQTKVAETGRTVQPRYAAAYSRKWLVTLVALQFVGVGIGPIIGGVELRLKNPLSGKTMSGTAKLYGGGASRPQFSPTRGFGVQDAEITTADKLEFKDFHDTYVRITRYSIDGDDYFYRVAFPNLGPDAATAVGSKVRFLGLPSIVVASGKLRMAGRYPDDPDIAYVVDPARSEMFLTSYPTRSAESAVVTFASNSHVVDPSQQEQLDLFINGLISRTLFAP